jgi:hypothetical protein
MSLPLSGRKNAAVFSSYVLVVDGVLIGRLFVAVLLGQVVPEVVEPLLEPLDGWELSTDLDWSRPVVRARLLVRLAEGGDRGIGVGLD